MPFHLTLPYILLLPLLGAAVAAIGTLAGLGGGFILVPILLVLFPDEPPTTITTISLTVVFLNAASATAGNLRARRIDRRTSLLMLLGAVPAAIAGSIVASSVSRDRFEIYLGILLLVGAVYILWRSARAAPLATGAAHDPNRRIQERRGALHVFYVNGLLAGIISPAAGFVSSFFGIGGGVIHVPALTFLLKVPFRIATATSLLVLVATSFTALLTLIASGEAQHGWRRAGLLGLGALAGAQAGIYLAPRIPARLVLLVVAVALALVGLRQLLAAS